jgi:hypothetical protein
VAGEFASEVEILAVGLFEGGAQGLDLLAVLLLELVDLAGECEDDGIGVGGLAWHSGGRLGLVAELLDALAKVGVLVEEGLRDGGFPADGLEGIGSPRFTRARMACSAAAVLVLDLALAAALSTALRRAYQGFP